MGIFCRRRHGDYLASISNYLAIYIHRWEMFLGISLLIIVFKFRKGIWGNIQTMGEYFQRPKEARPAEEKRA